MSSSTSKSQAAAPVVPKFEDHTRVRVAIKNPNQWSKPAAERLNGVVGRTDSFSADSFNGDNSRGPAYLVQFDEPIPSWHWHSAGEPVREFWFAESDLEALP
jgi:hypothetical protein